MRRLVFALPLALLAACTSNDKYRAKEEEAKKYQASLAETEATLKATQASLDEAKAAGTTKDAEISTLKSDAAKKDADLEAMKTHAAELATAKADLEKKSAEYEQLAGSLKEQISAGQIELTELRGKMTVKMKDKILFSSGSASIGKQGQAALKAVADALKNVQGKTIRVEGHTDNVPAKSTKYSTNWELSAARALAVVQFLQAQGVDPANLAAAGYGEFKPIASNDTPEGRSLNRRIEIVLAAAEPPPESTPPSASK
jgi:chemotaxis protein MotB